MRRLPLCLLWLILSLCLLAGCGARDVGTATSTVVVQATVAASATVAPDATPAGAATIESDIPTATPESPEAEIPIGVTPIASIYNENIPATRAERIMISEVFLMLEA